MLIEGTANFDTLSGSTRSDLIKGFAEDDSLKGLAGDDLIIGGAGADKLTGNAGNDTLNGGTTGDVLTGGKGKDVFLYTSSKDVLFDSGSASFHDLITDFKSGADQLHFNRESFGFETIPGVPKSQLAPSQFIVISDPNANYENTDAKNSSPVLIYEQPSQAEISGGFGGILLYDSDGRGAGNPVPVTFFSPRGDNAVALTRQDIVLF